ncbi:UNVERIFIED_CONTAM: hypothetical protein HDU68_003927 [Siphonaria sp. JEL0065]|nr:hypothetical protein HDU68_003927 [Siphonaria sp. JEL0065]
MHVRNLSTPDEVLDAFEEAFNKRLQVSDDAMSWRNQLVLISNKAARETLFLMMDCGMILLGYVRNSNLLNLLIGEPDRTFPKQYIIRTFYLWCVSKTLIQETYQMIASLKIRQLKKYNAHGQLIIERIERSGIKADESFLTDEERFALDHVNGMMKVAGFRVDWFVLQALLCSCAFY